MKTLASCSTPIAKGKPSVAFYIPWHPFASVHDAWRATGQALFSGWIIKESYTLRPPASIMSVLACIFLGPIGSWVHSHERADVQISRWNHPNFQVNRLSLKITKDSTIPDSQAQKWLDTITSHTQEPASATIHCFWRTTIGSRYLLNVSKKVADLVIMKRQPRLGGGTVEGETFAGMES